ncbi:hypothetical protein TNCV_1235421 [Trichonephila clavipes]|nr:hypothetical protein TNCV_1235421 [Trichonephila clavipes]
MNFDIIIGLIKQANLTITPDSVMFSKPQIEVPDASPQPFVFAITDEIPKFDISPEIPKPTRNDVKALLVSYRPNKIKATDIELRITVTNDKPIYHSPRRLPFTERDIVDKQIDEWAQNGIIESCSSAYASQVLVVHKKDSSPRVCIDFRKLNRVLVKDHYPLPLIENILDKLQNTRVFSTIDLRNGFFHVPVNIQSRPYTSFVTQNGPYDNYCIKNNILYKFIDGAEVLVIPDEMQHHFIKNAHDKGHFSVKRTLEHIKNKYFIPQLQSKIEKYISNCETCILKNKILVNRKDFSIKDFFVKDDVPLNKYHIDHSGPLATSSKNYKYILAVIDSFTKFVWLYPTKTTSTSEVIKKLDIQKTTFGNPRFLITDRGTTFTSDEFHTYCSEQNISLHHITTGLPRANGQVERINRTIILVLSKMSEDDPTKWFKQVPSLQEVLNSTFQRSINSTPFELLFGTQINNKTD